MNPFDDDIPIPTLDRPRSPTQPKKGQSNSEPNTIEEARRCLSPYSFKRWKRKHSPSNWDITPGTHRTQSSVAPLMPGAPGGVAPSSIALNNPVMGLQSFDFASIGFVPINTVHGAVFAKSASFDQRPSYFIVIMNLSPDASSVSYHFSYSS